MGLMSEYISKKMGATELEKELQRLIAEYNKKRSTYLLVFASVFGKPIPDVALSQEDFYIISDMLRNKKGQPKLDVYLETPGGSGEAAEEMNLEAQSLAAFLEVANRVLTIMQALLGSVGALALLVATLGVANTMMMAIYERTREIGVLKAVGATNGEVRRMFTADAVLLGLIGGVVGVIFGTLLGRLVDWAGHLYLASEGVTGIGQMSIVPAPDAFTAYQMSPSVQGMIKFASVVNARNGPKVNRPHIGTGPIHQVYR